MFKLTAEQKIERAVTTVMRCKELAFYASILLIGKREVMEPDNLSGCRTAMTDGKDERYCRPFVDKLTDEELVFVILHECMHKLFRHTQMWGDLYRQDSLVANAACDYVVNLMLMDMWKRSSAVQKVMQPLMEDGKYNFLYDEKYRDMDAKQVFLALQKEVPPPEPPEGGDEEDEDGETEGQGREPSDDGDDGGTVKGKKGKSKSDDAGDDDGGSGPSREELAEKQFDQHQPAEEQGRNAEEQQQLDIEIDRAIRNGMMIAGKLGGMVAREVKELIEVKVDWREVMRDYFKQACKGGDNTTWRRFNRKLFVNDIYAPTYESERVGRVVIAVDTSGSIDHLMIKAMLSNVVSICEETAPEEVVLMYWDTAVHNVETYNESSYATLLDSTKPSGFGGTDVRCVADYIRATYTSSEVDCVMILTDGAFYDGQGIWMDMPLLWCILEPYHKNFTPEYGAMVPVSL